MRNKLFLFLFILVAENVFGDNSPFWGSLKPGQYSTGFQVLNRYDYGRPYIRKYDYEGNMASGERGRPIQINIWYPAKSGGTPMSLSDYVHFTATEDLSELTPEKKQQSESRFIKARWFQGAPEETLRQLLQKNSATVRDAQHADGKFPLVVIANSSGLSSPMGQFVLAEYLASHGYIVASSPARGGQLPVLGSRDAHVQMQDLQFVIGTLHEFPSIDRDRLGVIGFGMGGLSAALLSMQNSDVDAFVSLDSFLANRFGYSLVFQNSLYKPNQLTVPILHITSQQPAEDTDYAFFQAVKFAPVEYLRLKDLGPADFSSLGMLKSFLPPPKEGKVANTKLGYETICIYTQNFLDASLHKNSTASQFLKNNPEQNEIPADFAKVEFKAAIKTPPTEQQFVEILRKQGAQKGAEIQREFSKLDPEIRIYDPDSLYELADEYAQNKKTDDAVAVLKLCIEGFPDYWESYDRIGKIYMDSGNKQLAIENLSKSIELNPENPETTEALKKLRES
jgi:hypothetical protein